MYALSGRLMHNDRIAMIIGWMWYSSCELANGRADDDDDKPPAEGHETHLYSLDE